MINLEIDGQAVQVDNGATVMDAATKAGVFVPHFCYHKKLSIAANCRMCLVQVEKAPKPLPACATPATEGMKVHTKSEQAITAQKGVMEFLLINHPLDCPICDQGGECQLQDLAVGYGGSASRYQEEKRVVFVKNIGPLVSAEEMSRCIHCTRCVRFGQEVAGVMELGMAGRGEHSEILSFVGRSVDSELSGNMIDLCPVGALTSKPFRYSARPWELSRRKSVAAHDGLGSNVVAQVKNDKVLRVLPLENDDVNECWISDRDRFSYEALNSDERLTTPMLREGDTWRPTDWQTALSHVANELKRIASEHGGSAIGALASSTQTLEELFLLQKLVRGLGSENIDFRTRQIDFSLEGKNRGVTWLGMPVADIAKQQAVLVVGSTLRKEQPLLANRFRQAAKKGQKFMVLHVVDDDLLLPTAAKSIVKPSQLAHELAGIVKAASELKGVHVTKHMADVVAAARVSDNARAIAKGLVEKERTAVFLGRYAVQHADFGLLRLLAQELHHVTGCVHGIFGAAANTVGARLVRAVPGVGGLDAQRMWREPRKAYVLVGVEPERDVAAADAARTALGKAEFVVELTSFKRENSRANVLLPMSPPTETAGTFVNMEGRVQSFNGVVKPLGDARPAWKVLRVLGNLVGQAEMAYETIDDVRTAIAPDLQAFATAKLSNAIDPTTLASRAAPHNIERIAEVPIYHADPLVRRAESLAKTRDAKDAALLRANASTLAELGLVVGQMANVSAGERTATVQAALDGAVPQGCVRLALGTTETEWLDAVAPLAIAPLNVSAAAD